MLERLAEWLLGESIAFGKLDAFRVELGLDVPAMARLLGVSPTTYCNWRKARAVPMGNRERLHESVIYALSGGEPSKGTGADRSDVQTTRFDPIGGGLARRLHGVTARIAFRTATPSRTTPAATDWKHAPYLWLDLEGAHLRREQQQGREARLHAIRELHGAGCECRECAPAPVAQEVRP